MNLTKYLLHFIIIVISTSTPISSWGQHITKLSDVFPASKLQGHQLMASFNKQTAKVITLDERYKMDRTFHNGILTIKDWETGLFGFVNEQGDLLAGGFKWHPMSPTNTPKFSHGATIVKTRKRNTSIVLGWDDTYYILYKNGSTKEIKGFGQIINTFGFNDDGIAVLEVRGPKGGTRIAYMNSQGQAIYRNLWEDCHTNPVPLGKFNDGLACFYRQGAGYGYINRQGQIVIPAKYSEAENFSQGMAVVRTTIDNRSRYIYINTNGQQAISMSFNEKPSAFSHGYCVARKSDRSYVMIDKQGNIASKGYKAITPFYPNGRALAEDGNGVHIIDTTFRHLHNLSDLNGGIYNFGHVEAPECINGLFYLNGNCYDFEGNYCRVYGANYQQLASENLIYVQFEKSYTQQYEGFINYKNGNLVVYIEKK